MKTRSPFFGASKQDLRTFRACAHKVNSWKKAAAAGNYYQLCSSTDAPADPRFAHAHVIFQSFHGRGWKVLDRLPSGPALRETYRLAQLQRYKPEQYELTMLRKEVSSLRCELADERVDGSKGRIPPEEWMSL